MHLDGKDFWGDRTGRLWEEMRNGEMGNVVIMLNIRCLLHM